MQRWNRSHCHLIGLMITVLAGCLPAIASACAVCWGGDDNLARGLNASMLFLMSMPFLIAGSILMVLFVTVQRARGQKWPYFTMKHGLRAQAVVRLSARQSRHDEK